MITDVLVPTILSGGTGARLWPVSRQSYPKPFMKLPDGETLLQKTFLRAVQLDNVTEILTITNQDYYFKTKDEYAAIQPAKITFLLEPVARNTAPAIALAALKIRATYGDDAVMLVLPADHLIEDKFAFKQAVQHAYELAKKNYLVTFGVKPQVPETGFGYIECGVRCDFSSTAHVVTRFVEKPSLELALSYVNSGNYLWNAGIFCFKTHVILKQFETHAAALYKNAIRCWEITHQKANGNNHLLEIDTATFAPLTDISLDYAILEKAKEVVVVPGQFGWSDLGSWNTVSKLTPSDERGNRIIGETVLVDVSNTYVQSEERLVAAVGIENLVIIDTPDALLIADQDCVQDVKKIVEQLKITEHESYKLHRTVTRPWGTYTVLEQGPGFKIKRIVVKPGAALSLQVHQHRSEHWIVVRGTARIINGNDTFLIEKNESTYIPAGHQHRLENPGQEDLILIEVQTGSYLGEDDIVRLQDKYGRINSPV